MRRLWIAVALFVAAVVVFVAITMVALEGREVVVVRTRGAQGVTHETRIWIADYEGGAVIEAANPERPFYQDLLQEPVIELQRQGYTSRYRATVLPQPGGHELIRRLLRQRYGWADWWIGLIADTSQSLGIKLEPLPS